jgi:molybdopterin-binding protein
MDASRLILPRDAARLLGISYSALKQWIYKGKIRTIRTPGGHHRIPQPELDRFLFRKSEHQPVPERRERYRRISGRNQLIGRVIAIQVDGLIAQVSISIGGQLINSVITSDASREMGLRPGDTVAALIKSTSVMIARDDTTPPRPRSSPPSPAVARKRTTPPQSSRS